MVPKGLPFEFIEHTADVGILARGATLAEAFQNAAQGMFSIIADLSRVAEKAERRVTVAGRDLEGLLVAWLSELLYIFDAEGVIFSRFAIDEIGPLAEGLNPQLRARVCGEPFDPERHEPRLAVKAVTRHQLSVRQGRDGWEARVILDI